MKKLRILAFAGLATLLLFLPQHSFAALRDSFFFKPFATVEYSAPRFYGDSRAKRFATDSFFTQLKNFDNIAIGFHGRVHKYVGFNFNWSQTDLSSTALKGYEIAKKAELALDYFNVSALFFAPLIEDSFLELFGELGLSKMKSKINISETSGKYTKKTTSETVPFVGIGVQLAPFESSQDAIRVSFQHYLNKLDLVQANFSTIRIGYVKSF